jgi:hypothetical protein
MSRAFRIGAATVLLLILALANLRMQSLYLAATIHKGWDETLDRLHSLSDNVSESPVWIGLQDAALPALAEHYTEDRPTWVLSGDDFVPIGSESAPKEMIELDAALSKLYRPRSFALEAGGAMHDFVQFDPPPEISQQNASVILPAADGSVVNASHARPLTGRVFVAPLAEQRNTLVQVNSNLARTHLPGLTEHVGLWDHEPDFTGWPNGIQAVGRHVLFEVLKPVPGSRLLLDYTAGALAGQGLFVPPAIVYGTDRYTFDLEGVGAARVLSAPIVPREIQGRFYIAIDFGADERGFTAERHGLAALYNTELSNDPRRIVGFVRNISLLTPEQAAALDPPVALNSFPVDLGDPGLLFSGATEDGWIAKDAWFQLGAAKASDVLLIGGEAPGFSPKLANAEFDVFVDAQRVVHGRLGSGVLNLSVAIPPASGNRRIELRISDADRLPQPDGRFVSIRLTKLSLAKSGPAGAGQ